jgi:hypothetical protein
MIRILPFHQGHLDFFTAKYDYGNIEKDLVHALESRQSTILTLASDTSVIAILGINLQRPGLGELWMLVGADLDRYFVSFQKSVDELLSKTKEMNIHRLQMSVDCTFETGIRWAKHMGFKEEGVMEAYDSQGRDHFLFAKVIK